MDQITPPGILEQMKTFGEAIKNWTIKDGMKVVPPEVLELRKNTCSGCEHWDKEAFGGIGKCKVCGCSASKLYIPSAVCPLNPPKWKPVTVVDGKVVETECRVCQSKQQSTPQPPVINKTNLVVTGKTSINNSSS